MTTLRALIHRVLPYTKYIVIVLAVITVPLHIFVHDAVFIAVLYAAQTVLAELDT